MLKKGFRTEYCQTPVLGLGLGVDFTFANNNKKNPPPKFSKKEQYYGNEIWHTDLTHKDKILGQLSQSHLLMKHLSW